MKPIFFFGLGTTGSEIVSHIERIIQTEGDAKIKKWTTCVGIDSATKEKSNSITLNRFLSLSRGNPATADVLEEMVMGKNNRALGEATRQWFPMDGGKPENFPFATFEDGCGGMRHAGRLLFHRARLGSQLSTYHSDVSAEVNRMIATGSLGRNEIEFNNPICYVFGNLAGGTCSGMLIDFAILLRARFPAATTIVGCFMLGDVCHSHIPDTLRTRSLVRQQDGNTLAALSELMMVQTKGGFEMVRDQWPKRFGQDDVSNAPGLSGQVTQPPFDLISFIGGTRDGGLAMRNFSEYGKLAALYHARQIINEHVAERAGNSVDAIAQSRTALDRPYPYRFNNAARVGYVQIGIPSDKIIASAMGQIAQGAKNRHLKNTDAERYEAAHNHLLNQLNWEGFRGIFAAPQCSHPEQQRENHDTLPDKSEDFANDWSNTLNATSKHYKDWIESTGERSSAGLVAAFLETRWKEARIALLMDLLGGDGNHPATLGTLNDVLVSFSGEITAIRSKCNDDLLRINQLLADGSPNGLEAAARREIDEAVATWPGKRLGIFRIKGWAGTETIYEKAKAYRDAMASKACLETTLHALSRIAEDVSVLQVARKLVGKEIAFPVISPILTKSNSVFSLNSDLVSSVDQEAISDRESIDRFWRTRILVKDDVAQSEAGVARALTRAISMKGDTLGGFAALVAQLSESGSALRTDAEEAARDPDIRILLGQMRNVFGKHFVDLEHEIREKLAKTSVWDAVCDSIIVSGAEPRKSISDAFSRYHSLSSPTPECREVSEDFESKAGYQRRLVFFCDQTEAERLLRERLQIERTITELVNDVFADEAPLVEHIPGMKNIIILKQITRENPEQYTHFRGLEHIFMGGKIADDLVWRFADSRIPEWIEKFVAAKGEWLKKQDS